MIDLFIAAICCLIFGASPANAMKRCINSLPSDSFSFGSSLATYGKYLVVGDSEVNHIVIYTRDQDNKWLRTREILPPKDSTAYKVGSGFGNTIALDGDNLIIGSFTVIKPENNNNEIVNLKDFQEDNGIFSTSTALYQTRLDREAEVKRIDLPNIPTKGVLPTGRVVADNGQIGFLFSQKQPAKWIRRINQVYVLSNGEAHRLPDGKLEYEIMSKVGSISIYGSNIALKKNLLLVGVDRDKDRGGVWLFDLNSPQSKPEKLTLPFAAPAEVSIAISEQFIAVSNTPKSFFSYLFEQSGITLIRNISTGSTIITDGVGELSLDGNILVRMRYVPDGRENQAVDEIPKIVEVFRLDDDATPHLIQTLDDVRSALVQNGLLITVHKTVSGKRICTEQIR